MLLAGLMSLLSANPAFCSNFEFSQDENGQDSTDFNMVQTAFVGSGLALLTTGMLVEGKEVHESYFYPNNGTDMGILVRTETGLEQKNFFLVGATFFIVAGLLELLETDDVEANPKTEEQAKHSLELRGVEAVSLIGGSEAFGVVLGF